MDYSKMTLGELLSHQNETIRRNAVSILKRLQSKIAQHDTYMCPECRTTATWSAQDYRDRGTPVCAECGDDMIFVPIKD